MKAEKLWFALNLYCDKIEYTFEAKKTKKEQLAQLKHFLPDDEKGFRPVPCLVERLDQ